MLNASSPELPSKCNLVASCLIQSKYKWGSWADRWVKEMCWGSLRWGKAQPLLEGAAWGWFFSLLLMCPKIKHFLPLTMGDCLQWVRAVSPLARWPGPFLVLLEEVLQQGRRGGSVLQKQMWDRGLQLMCWHGRPAASPSCDTPTFTVCFHVCGQLPRAFSCWHSDFGTVLRSKSVLGGWNVFSGALLSAAEIPTFTWDNCVRSCCTDPCLVFLIMQPEIFQALRESHCNWEGCGKWEPPFSLCSH